MMEDETRRFTAGKGAARPSASGTPGDTVAKMQAGAASPVDEGPMGMEGDPMQSQAEDGGAWGGGGGPEGTETEDGRTWGNGGGAEGTETEDGRAWGNGGSASGSGAAGRAWGGGGGGSTKGGGAVKSKEEEAAQQPMLGAALSGVIVEKHIRSEEDSGVRGRRFQPPQAFADSMQGVGDGMRE